MQTKTVGDNVLVYPLHTPPIPRTPQRPPCKCHYQQGDAADGSTLTNSKIVADKENCYEQYWYSIQYSPLEGMALRARLNVFARLSQPQFEMFLIFVSGKLRPAIFAWSAVLAEAKHALTLRARSFVAWFVDRDISE